MYDFYNVYQTINDVFIKGDFAVQKNFYYLLFIFSILLLLHPTNIQAKSSNNIYEQRRALYEKTEALTLIPWYYLAAIDQYERQINNDLADDQLISIQIPDEQWFGINNISKHDDVRVIELFNGIGQDGNGDNRADPKDPEDILFTMAHYLLTYGQSKNDIKIALWNYYKRDLTVKTIMNTARIFKKFQTIELTERSFPIDQRFNYSYRSTWGHRRGFGGLRIHEGTDIFANYGTPVHATTYGVVEMLGWNIYGGWRVGIRDIYNIYHYYAHLNRYTENLQIGQIVKPGDLLGTVGSSGYGPPGTSGKFPPHLHYGMYKDNGYNEWSFDPYPYLRRWEK